MACSEGCEKCVHLRHMGMKLLKAGVFMVIPALAMIVSYFLIWDNASCDDPNAADISAWMDGHELLRIETLEGESVEICSDYYTKDLKPGDKYYAYFQPENSAERLIDGEWKEAEIVRKLETAESTKGDSAFAIVVLLMVSMFLSAMIVFGIIDWEEDY